MDIAPTRLLPVLLQGASADDRRLLELHGQILRQLGRLQAVEFLADGTEPPPCATALLGGMRILVPMAGLIDVAAERQRLGKALARAQAERGRIEAKLANVAFASNAPPEVVARERDKLRSAEQEISQLDEQLARLARLG